MNYYLKGNGDVCEINPDIAFHWATHTCAITVKLSIDVSNETVSKNLGNKALKPTQHYAPITDRKISKDMAML